MNYKCKYCGWLGLRKDFELDHAIPISRSILENTLQPNLDLICSGCNRQKGSMTGQEYLFWRILYSFKANLGPL